MWKSLAPVRETMLLKGEVVADAMRSALHHAFGLRLEKVAVEAGRRTHLIPMAFDGSVYVILSR